MRLMDYGPSLRDPDMRLAGQIQPDVSAAFSLEELRAFLLPNGRRYAVVGHNPDQRLISDIWFGAFGSQRAFKDVLEFICERFETGGYAYWLADLRYLNEDFHESEAWLVEEVVPRVMAAGLQREAVVMPASTGQPEGFDVYGSASDTLRHIADGRVRGFTDIRLAKLWLQHGLLDGSGAAEPGDTAG